MREKFSSQADPKLLAKVREIANNEGRLFQSVLEEALQDFLEKRKNTSPRKNVMNALKASMDEFDELYKNLAK
jgi:predicted transcriptional regulator